MQETFEYQLYVGNDCNCCERVIASVQEKSVPVKIINIDNDDYDLSFSLMIIPALVKEDKLIGYGADIQHYFDGVNLKTTNKKR